MSAPCEAGAVRGRFRCRSAQDVDDALVGGRQRGRLPQEDAANAWTAASRRSLLGRHVAATWFAE